MAVSLGPELRDLICEAIAARFANSRLRVYSGTLQSPVLLAEIPCAGLQSQPVNGEITLEGFLATPALTTGEASFWRLVADPNSPFANQTLLTGTAGDLDSDADLKFANPNLVEGLPVVVSYFQFVAPL